MVDGEERLVELRAWGEVSTAGGGGLRIEVLGDWIGKEEQDGETADEVGEHSSGPNLHNGRIKADWGSV